MPLCWAFLKLLREVNVWLLDSAVLQSKTGAGWYGFADFKRGWHRLVQWGHAHLQWINRIPLWKKIKIAGKVLQGGGNLEAHSCHQTCTNGDKEACVVTYIPPFVLVRDLHEKAEKQCLEEGGMSVDVPSLSTLYRSFVPSNDLNDAASNLFGRITVKRGMTNSSGRLFGSDSHYNAKSWQPGMWKYIVVRRIL